MTRAGATPSHSSSLVLSLLGLAAGFVLWRTAPEALLTAPLWLAVGLALVGLAELGAVRIQGGGQVSPVSALDVAAVFLLGPAAALWIHAIAILVVEGLLRRRAAGHLVRDVSVAVATIGVAGWVFRLAGGGPGALELPAGLLPMAAACAAYFVTESTVASVAAGLSSGIGPRRSWQQNFGRSWLYHASFLALGALLATTVGRTGPWALLLFLLPGVVARHAFAQHVAMRSDLKDFVRALSEVLDEVDPYTRQHSVRVAEYAVRLARGMGCSEAEAEDVEYGALVHDLGKIGPQHQRILQKPGSLTHEDQRTLRGHPAAGAGILGRVRALRRAAEAVRLHHERPDGRGYPFGLRSDQVPLGARILNVADAFDAMTSDRPYRRALEVPAALRELDRGAGTQFDRGVVNCLLGLHASGRFPKLQSPSSEELRLLRIRPPHVRA